MSNIRDELIEIQAVVNLIIVDVERVNDIRLTDVDNRLQALIENLEEMLELDTQHVQDVYEYLCDAPMEFTSIFNPPESRNRGIEQLISQLEAIITKNEDIEA